jgi:hypothetical protein
VLRGLSPLSELGVLRQLQALESVVDRGCSMRNAATNIRAVKGMTGIAGLQLVEARCCPLPIIVREKASLKL